MKAILGLVISLLLAGASTPQITGRWTGTAQLNGETRDVSVDFYQQGAEVLARYSIPGLDLEQIPMGPVKWDEAQRTLSAGHAFDGRLEADRLAGRLRPMLLHGSPVSVSLAPGGDAPAPGTLEEAVSFQSRGLTLRGTLVRPKAAGRYSALVSLHGSGPSTRWFALGRARRFARAGFAMLIFDKPGSGQSEGDWTMTSLDEMAADALAAVDYLRTQSGIDPDRTGLWGHSQAGHVVSRALALRHNVAFAIVLAGGGTRPREVEEFGYSNRLRRNGASADVAKGAMSWVGRYLDYEGSGRGYEAVVAELNAHPEWKTALGISTVYPTPEQQPKWAWVANYQPLEDIARIRVPVLLLFAELDEESPGERSLKLWRDGLRKGGNRQFEAKLFAKADHHFLVASPSGGWPSFAPGYYEMQFDWLNRRFGR